MKTPAPTRLLKTASSVVIGLAVGTLTGCFPYVTTYVYLDSPGVSYKRSPCYDGAPVAAAYQRDEVHFEVTLEPHALSYSKEAYLKLRAPRNIAIAIPDPIVLVTFHGARKLDSTSVQLKAVPLDWQGPYVADMRRQSPLMEYRFVFGDLPPIHSPGTLQLPVVFADGIAIPSPLFTFDRRAYAGVVPLNC